MLVSKSSDSSRSSKWRAPKKPHPRQEAGFPLYGIALLLTLIAVIASAYSWSRGYTLYDGDAEAHLDIARRILDSRTPGPEQIGTGWLPLPHLLLLPFAMADSLWRNALAGVIPSALALVVAGCFLYAALRRLISPTAGLAAVLLLALNTNILYLSAVPMTEMLFLATLCGLLWGMTWFSNTQGWGAVLLLALISNAASLTRYEGWVLIPFLGAFLLFTGSASKAAAFTAIALLAPLSWLAHNQYYFSDALEFYRGEWSAQAVHRRSIAAGVIYPTDHNWRASFSFYVEALRLVAGTPLALLGLAGTLAALYRRAWWPLAFLALCPLFYIASLYGAGADLYVPSFWPYTFYNTRYAVAGLLFVIFCGATLIGVLPPKLGKVLAVVLPVGLFAIALLSRPAVMWQEAAANSAARREAQSQAAAYLRSNYEGGGVVYPFGTLTGVLRESGIAIKNALHDGNHPDWDAAVARPAMFLHEEWALATPGDAISAMLVRAQVGRPPGDRRVYRLRNRIAINGTPTIEIYHLEE